MPKRFIVDVTPDFDKLQSFLQTQPNPTPINDHQRGDFKLVLPPSVRNS
jgi:hypothetical protein